MTRETKQTRQTRQTRETRIRNALLVKVHIAKKEMGIFDEDYREILQREFGVGTAAHLENRELAALVEYFGRKGWEAGKLGGWEAGRLRGSRQAEALKERIGQELLHSDFTEKRLRGIVRKICGVDDLMFCRDVKRLKRLLAVIRSILDKE